MQFRRVGLALLVFGIAAQPPIATARGDLASAMAHAEREFKLDHTKGAWHRGMFHVTCHGSDAFFKKTGHTAYMVSETHEPNCQGGIVNVTNTGLYPLVYENGDSGSQSIVGPFSSYYDDSQSYYISKQEFIPIEVDIEVAWWEPKDKKKVVTATPQPSPKPSVQHVVRSSPRPKVVARTPQSIEPTPNVIGDVPTGTFTYGSTVVVTETLSRSGPNLIYTVHSHAANAPDYDLERTFPLKDVTRVELGPDGRRMVIWVTGGTYHVVTRCASSGTLYDGGEPSDGRPATFDSKDPTALRAYAQSFSAALHVPLRIVEGLRIVQ